MSKRPVTGPQLGMLIGLASVGMLFGALLLTFLLHRARAPVWPPLGMERVPPLLPALATAMLAASSFFIHAAYRQLQANEPGGFRRFWGIGTFLGALFLILQAGTWARLHAMGLKMGSNFLVSIFFILTGFHAVHVIAGLGGLAWVWLHAPNAQSTAPQLWGWFWHFMDAIWVVMFALLVVSS